MSVKSKESYRCGWGEDRTGLMEILWVERRGQGKEKNEGSRGCACDNERRGKKGEEDNLFRNMKNSTCVLMPVTLWKCIEKW